MYAIWCKLNDGSEGWFYDFDFDGINAVIVDVVSIQLLHPHYTCVKSANAVRKACNVLSAEAREVCVVEKATLNESVDSLRELSGMYDEGNEAEECQLVRMLIARLEAVCGQ